jgi:hypothetical protein
VTIAAVASRAVKRLILSLSWTADAAGNPAAAGLGPA